MNIKGSRKSYIVSYMIILYIILYDYLIDDTSKMILRQPKRDFPLFIYYTRLGMDMYTRNNDAQIKILYIKKHTII